MEKILMIGLLIISLIGRAWAQDSFSISVSCSIPAVPGLNAPLIEEETPRVTETDEFTQKDAKNQEEIRLESPTLLQEDKEKQIQLAEGETSTVIVQTIYSR